MKKLLSVLLATLMLLTCIPLSVSAAEGDVVASIDWNDGELKFDQGEIAEGPDGSSCFKWTANGGWSATYMVLHDMDPAKDYTITMKAKASVAGNMGITIQNGDWVNFWNAPAFAVTTQWKDVVYTIPANSIPFTAGAILFKFQDVGVAMDLYVDDFVVSEGLPELPDVPEVPDTPDTPDVPGVVTNGDFETGSIDPWMVHQQATVKAEAKYEGNYGAHLHGNGSWGGIMDMTFAVEAGKTYKLSFWIKVNNIGVNLQIKDGDSNGASLASGTWFAKNSHSEWTKKSYVITSTTGKVFLNFCGAGGASANPSAEEDAFVDAFTLETVKEPTSDGFITNGDFETGDLSFDTSQGSTPGVWYNLWGSTTHELVTGYNSNFALKGTAKGAYNITYQNVVVEPNTDYTVSVYSKNSQKAALWIKNAGGNGDITNKEFNTGSDWKRMTLTFNSGSNTSVWVGLMGIEANGTYTVDNVTVAKAVKPSNDGYIINGTFETGDIAPWDNLWGSCPKAEIVPGGKGDNYALEIVSDKWTHVRQTDIAVKANTNYKITLWAKNVTDMALLVKDGGDKANVANVSIEGGKDWTKNEIIFNSGANTSILISFMGGESGNQHGTFDNIKMEKFVCSHKYDAGKVTKAATCTKTGVKTYTCSVCKATKTETIAKKAHTYSNATCTKAKTCKVCKATTGKALGHKWNSGKVTKAATCAKTGVKTYTCSVCKGTKTETIAKIKTHKYTNACDTSCNVCKATRTITHKYTTVTKAATATANGYTVKRCSVCKKETGKTTIYKASTIKLSKTTYVYNGKVQKPTVTIKDSKGKTISTSNYTVTYATGRKNVGTYKVTIKFKGKYSGTKTLTFKINPAGTTVSKVTAGTKKLTVNVAKKTAQVTGYEIQYATNKSFKSAKTKTLSSYKKTSLSLTGLKAKTTYYIRVRTYKVVSGKKVYSAWSVVKTAKTK